MTSIAAPAPVEAGHKGPEWNAGYSQGYVVACGLIQAMFGETTLAIEVLSQDGVTWAEIEAMGLSDYDMTSLRKLAEDPLFPDRMRAQSAPVGGAGV